MKRTIAVGVALLVCGCTLYMSNVNKDVDVSLDKMSGRYYLRRLNVVVDRADAWGKTEKEERLARERQAHEQSIGAAIRAALTDAELSPYFEDLPFGREPDKRLMPVDIKVRVWRVYSANKDDPLGFPYGGNAMRLSNTIAAFSLSAWPMFFKDAEWVVDVALSSDLRGTHRRVIRMEDGYGMSLVPTAVIAYLFNPDYADLCLGSDDERQRVIYRQHRTEQAVRMVKSLCSELPDAYTKWLNRQPWYIEEKDQKDSEAAYAQFADETRSAAERLAALKQVTNVAVRTRHARELIAAFQSETNEDLKAMILSRLDNESLSSLPYDARLVTRWRDISNPRLLSIIYAKDAANLSSADAEAFATRLCRRSSSEVSEQLNAPANTPYYIASNEMWFSLLRKSPLSVREEIVSKPDFLQRVSAQSLEALDDGTGTRNDLTRVVAEELMQGDERNGLSDSALVTVIARTPSEAIRSLAFERLTDSAALWARIREGGEEAARLVEILQKRASVCKGANVLYTLAQVYEEGVGVEVSDAKAAACYQQVLDIVPHDDAKWIGSLNALGALYAAGRGVEKSDEKARDFYLQAAMAGDAVAQSRLLDLYGEGRIDESFAAKEIEWTKDAQERLETGTQFAYLCGLLMEKESIPGGLEGAFSHYLKAAKDGVGKAQLKVGTCYESGRGVRMSWASARAWYAKAYASGLAEGKAKLDAMAAREEAATRPYRDAAEKGDAWSIYKLARIYYSEDGVSDVEQDKRKGTDYFRKAAEKGCPEAQFTLGMLYVTGDDYVTRSSDEAVKWVRAAANQGHADAEYMMGEFCMEGFGVSKSIFAAQSWWLKASAQGHAGARQALERLGNGLSNLLNSL